MRRPALLAAVPLLATLGLPLSGCYADVESFSQTAAKHYCKRLRQCNRQAFVDAHKDDMGRCRDDIEDFLLDTADLLEAGGWEYDQDAGQACIAARREHRNDCSSRADREIGDACQDVIWGGF